MVELDDGGRLLSSSRLTGSVGALVRPEDVDLSAGAGTISAEGAGRSRVAGAEPTAPPAGTRVNRVAGTVDQVLDLGATALVRIAAAPPLTALVTRREMAADGFAPGMPVRAEFPPEAVHLFPSGSPAG